MNKSLWKLSNEVMDLSDKIHAILDDPDLGETEKSIMMDQLFEQYLAAEEKFNDRVIDCAQLVNYETALAKARRDESERLRVLAKSSEEKVERVKELMATYMQRSGIQKVNSPNHQISLRKKPAKVELECAPEDLPKKFQRVKVEADKKAIKKALDNRDPDVDGVAYLKQDNKKSVVIN